MRESLRAFSARTGRTPAAVALPDVAATIGSTPRPVGVDEPVPTLFRDVGPQALASFHAGQLRRLSGPEAPCLYLRDHSLPGFSAAVRELGVLTVLQPHELGLCHSGQAGIWLADADALPSAIGFVPAGEDLGALGPKLDHVQTSAELREVVADYDARAEQSQRDLAAYLELWTSIEAEARRWRQLMSGGDSALVEHAVARLRQEGITEKDLFAPLTQLSMQRRVELSERLTALAPVRVAFGDPR